MMHEAPSTDNPVGSIRPPLQIANLPANDVCFSSAFEFAAIGMTLVSPEGKFLQVNQALCQLLGYTADELVNLTFQDITHPDDLEADLAYVQQMLAGTINTYQMKKRYFSKPGNTIWVLLSVSLIRHENGVPLYFISQIQDISAIKQAEDDHRKLLEKLYRMQKDESMRRMVESIADQFDGVLHQVSANLEQIANADLLNAETGDLLAEALQSARRGTNISRLMRICIGQRTKEKTAIDLSLICRNALAHLSTGLLQILKTDFNANGPLVWADGEQIQEVLQSLLSNAADATAGGRGTVHVTLKTVPAATLKTFSLYPLDWEASAAEYASLTVSDTGSGISPDSMERIFDPFFTNKHPGQGLGLPMTLGIVRAHEGALAVESTPNQGTCVHIFLPVAVVQEGERG